MSILTLEGQATLPEKARVYVVVPDAPDRAPRVWSPRLADPAQAAAFSMQVTEARSGRH